MASTGSKVPAKGYRLDGISPRAFQHPADRAATAALGSIPYLDKVVRKLIELGYERALRQSYLGSSVRLSEDQLGDVYREHAIAYATLDMARRPRPVPHPVSRPRTRWRSARAARSSSCSPSSSICSMRHQRRAVFAHEAAHILADHQLYQTALYILVLLTRSSRLPLPLAPVRTALLEWSRATELSADRAAALVTRDPLVVCRTLMCLAGGAMVDELDLDAFMRQGLDYTEAGGGLERLTRLLLDLGVTHPMPVRRTHELMAWVRSGEYDRIVAGEYPRRGDPVDARADGGEAVSFYAERVRDAFRDAGESVNSAGQQLAGWLRGAGAGMEEDVDGERRGRGVMRAETPHGAPAASRRSLTAVGRSANNAPELRDLACRTSPAGVGAAGRPASGTVRRMTVPLPGAGNELQLAADELGALAHARHAEAALQAVAARAEPVGFGQPLPSSVTDARTTPSRSLTLTTACVACAWRLTFVSASCTTR